MAAPGAQIKYGPEQKRNTPAARESTPTSDFDGGVGRESFVEVEDTHVHPRVVASRSVQPADDKHTPGQPKTSQRTLYATLHGFTSSPVFQVLVWATRIVDHLPVLHPVAFVKAAVAAAEVALQDETVHVAGDDDAFGGSDRRFCNKENSKKIKITSKTSV